MRERTRAALSALIVAHEASPTEENFQAIVERAPLGNYYVTLDDGRKAIIDHDEDSLGLELPPKAAKQPKAKRKSLGELAAALA